MRWLITSQATTRVGTHGTSGSISIEGRRTTLFVDCWGKPPRLASIRQQIALLTKQIESVREAEKAEAARMDETLSEIKKQEQEATVFQADDGGERLQIRLNSMQEALHRWLLKRGSARHGEKEEEQSKALSMAVQDVEYLNRELEQVKNLQEAYLEKSSNWNWALQRSQRSLKELNLPETGFLYGPQVATVLVGGGAIGFLILAGWLSCLTWLTRVSAVPKKSLHRSVHLCSTHSSDGIGQAVKNPTAKVDNSLCTIHHSRGRVSEAYRSVRTGLFFSNRSGDLKVIQVTSPVPGDGKSTLASNLAVTMAQSAAAFC